MRLDIANWLYGLVSDLIKGGASAVTAALTVAVADPKDFNYADPKIYIVIGAVFGVHALLAVSSYLKDNPLPKIVTTTTIEKRTEHTSTTTTDDGKVIEERSPHTSITKTVTQQVIVDPKSPVTPVVIPPVVIPPDVPQPSDKGQESTMGPTNAKE
jgi:hypothetical protein